MIYAKILVLTNYLHDLYLSQFSLQNLLSEFVGLQKAILTKLTHFRSF